MRIKVFWWPRTRRSRGFCLGSFWLLEGGLREVFGGWEFLSDLGRNWSVFAHRCCNNEKFEYMITQDELLEIVCQEAGVTIESILRPFRGRNFVLARYVYIHTAKKLYGLKLKDLGLRFNFDHTTVLHGLKKINDLLSVKDEICCSLVNKVHARISELNNTPVKVILSIPGHLDANKICADLVSQYSCSIERV